MADLQIRAMTHEEFRQYRQRAISDYASEHIRAGNWTPEDAELRATEETDNLLPDGVETAGMVLLVGAIGEGVVGLVWVGLAPAQRAGWWIYDIEVLEAHRGLGYGRALLEAAEREAQLRGADSLGLNVFGGNDAARGLYESSGYEMVSTQMRSASVRKSRMAAFARSRLAYLSNHRFHTFSLESSQELPARV